MSASIQGLSSPIALQLNSFPVEESELIARINALSRAITKFKKENRMIPPLAYVKLANLKFELSDLRLREANKDRVFDITKMPEYIQKAKVFAKDNDELFNRIKETLEKRQFQVDTRQFLVAWKERLRYESIDYDLLKSTCLGVVRYKNPMVTDPVYDFLAANFTWWEDAK